MEPAFKHHSLPRPLLDRIVTRDAALWIDRLPGETLASSEKMEFLARFVGLPWRTVLVEDASASFASLIDSLADSRRLQAARGYVHTIAADPQNEPLPERCLPVYFLNGRDDRTGQESSKVPGNARTRRRLNMIERLRSTSAPALVVLTWDRGAAVKGCTELWEDEGFRATVTVVDISTDRVEKEIPLEHELVELNWDALKRQVELHLLPRLPGGGIEIRVIAPDKSTRIVDITSAEFVETPIRDTFEVLLASDLVNLSHEQLSRDEVDDFFRRSSDSWRPFAARLPWNRNPTAATTLIHAMRDRVGGMSRGATLYYILSERGAGGTTFARQVAFSVASEGYPTIVARSAAFHPEAGVVKSFIQNASRLIKEAVEPNSKASSASIPWLVVFDVHHWAGHEGELLPFLRELGKSGSPLIVLLVTAPPLANHVENANQAQRLATLSHRIEQQEALDFGRHLNVYLTPHGRSRRDDEWQAFWQTHAVAPSQGNASFWIALEFWLKRQIDMGESIQSWLYKQFSGATLDVDTRRAVLDIAALSIARESVPESFVLRRMAKRAAVALESAAGSVPALTLHRAWIGTERQWSLSHDILGRYLLTSLSYDQKALHDLGLGHARDSLHLRFLLLADILNELDMGREPERRLAIEFSTRIMKLESGAMGAELMLFWPEVLAALTEDEKAPRLLKRTSRIYLHHIAISCRRVATQNSDFDTTIAQRRELLNHAISYIEFAVSKISMKSDDESDLNLYNSLSLAYQDLAFLETSAGAPRETVAMLRAGASKAALKAQEVDNANSFVLETLARNLLQDAEFSPVRALAHTTEALYYVYQAMQLESSLTRHGSLISLADRALSIVRNADNLGALAGVGGPFACLARAWLALSPSSAQESWTWNLADLDPARLAAALGELENAKMSGNWHVIKLRYDLVSALNSDDFQSQVDILDELIGALPRVPIQVRHERAILLHQVNRHPEAMAEFRRLRRELKETSAFVRVPERLRWLRAKDGTKRRCAAKVVEVGDFRSLAKVADLGQDSIPLRPDEFGIHPRPGQTLYAFVSFGPMGPFLKPSAMD